MSSDMIQRNCLVNGGLIRFQFFGGPAGRLRGRPGEAYRLGTELGCMLALEKIRNALESSLT
jgi:hypothetical protein